MTEENILLYENDLPDNFKAADIVAIDTEAMGLDNYRDRLCLVQLSNGDDIAHLVKIYPNNYNAPNLKKLLSDSKIVKLFHFARFDVAIMNHYFDLDIKNIYCTKIASRLCRTYTDSHGLKDLINELLHKKISKQQQSSDWGADTLTDEQKKYAANDVLFLHQIKEKLDLMLAREGRKELAQSCFDFIATRVKLDLQGWKNDIFEH